MLLSLYNISELFTHRLMTQIFHYFKHVGYKYLTPSAIMFTLPTYSTMLISISPPKLVQTNTTSSGYLRVQMYHYSKNYNQDDFTHFVK